MENRVQARAASVEEARCVELFAALDDRQAERLLAHSSVRSAAKGEELFRQGDPAREFFCLRSGQVKLYRVSAEGQEKVIELVAPGQTFAESLMFLGKDAVFPVHAEAVEPCEVLAIKGAVFRELLAESPETAFRVMASMSRSLHQQVNEIERLSLHNATHRLVSYLLDQLPAGVVHSPNVCLSSGKHVIASRLSIQPETFSRILKRLADAGHIEVQGATVILRDIPALRALVQ